MAQATTNEIITPPKEEYISKDDPRKFLIIAYDLETTGLEPEDEIVQIGAYYANGPGGSHKFSQFVLPTTRKIHPDASVKIGLQVDCRDGKRVLIDTRSKQILPTASEESALRLFCDWLKLQLDQNGCYDTIVLVSHGAIFLDIPALVHALRRLNMAEQFYKVVSGFCDSNAVFKADLRGCFSSFSLERLYQRIMGGIRQGEHRAEIDARDLYLMLLKHYKVRSLSLQKCKSMARYTYTTRCMEEYVNWQDILEGRRQGLNVLMRCVYRNSMKHRRIFIKNLLAAGYDMPSLEKDFIEGGESSFGKFADNLRSRINQMKKEYESYLTDTKGVGAEEISRSVSTYFAYTRSKYLHQPPIQRTEEQ